MSPRYFFGTIFAPGIVAVALLFFIGSYTDAAQNDSSYSETEEGFDRSLADIHTTQQQTYFDIHNRYTPEGIAAWKRSPGSTRVGLQVGHLASDEVPEEIAGIRRNKSGARYKQIVERDIVHAIAKKAARTLEKHGVIVDILPATIPPGYSADAVVAIHADGNPNPSKRGFKVASPRRDLTGKALLLEENLFDAYFAATNMPEDMQITSNMRGYYAFNWPRFIHTIHPMTPAAIIEVGFLTNGLDRNVIIKKQDKAAEGIAQGILTFLAHKDTDEVALPTPQHPSFPVTGKLVCLNDHLYGSLSTPDCVLGIETKNERQYALDLNKFPQNQKQLLSSAALSVSGEYQPIRETTNYNWYHYDVDGIITVDSVK